MVYFCCCCYDKTLAKNSLKRKGSIQLPHPCHNPAQKEDKVGTEAETMENHCLVDCVHGLLSLFSSATQEQLPRSGTTHRGFDTPTSTIKQENSPTEILTCQSEGSSSSTEVCPSHILFQQTNQQRN